MKRAWMMVLPAIAMATVGPAAARGQAIAAAPQADNPRTAWTVTAYWENDGGILKRYHVEDKHYTNGLAVTVAGTPELADDIAPLIPLGGAMDRTALGFVAGQLMFTPEDISNPDLIPGDRPYAGYLYGGVYWQRAGDTTLDHVELNLGVIGPLSQAENLQEAVHESLSGVDPRGWRHQLDNEAQAQVFIRRKWRFNLAPIDIGGTRIEAQIIPQAGAAVGTVYRHLEAAGTLRVGWKLPDDFGPGRISDLPSAVGQPRPGWFGYGFVRAGGRAVAHNALLSGTNFQGSHGVDEEPLVGDLGAGVSLGYRGDRWAGEIGYSLFVIGEEFDGQDGSDEYASLKVSVTGWF